MLFEVGFILFFCFVYFVVYYLNVSFSRLNISFDEEGAVIPDIDY